MAEKKKYYSKEDKINYHINRANDTSLSREEREKSSKRAKQLKNSLRYSPEEKVNYLFKKANDKTLSTGQRWKASQMLKKLASSLNRKRNKEHVKVTYTREEQIEFHARNMENEKLPQGLRNHHQKQYNGLIDQA